MEKDDMKQCPYCAELIKKEAIKCRYCGSMLTKKEIKLDFLSTPGHWHRVNEGKKVAGVCTGIAKQLDSTILILPLRLFFILTTIFYGFGILLYIILWILMPAPIEPVSPEKESTGAESTEPSRKPAKEEAVSESTEETEEAEDSEQSKETEAKMSDMPRTVGMLALMVLILGTVYAIVITVIFEVTVSPLLLLTGFIVSAVPVLATVFALHTGRIPVYLTDARHI